MPKPVNVTPGGTRRQEDGTRRDPGPASLTRRPMKHGERFSWTFCEGARTHCSKRQQMGPSVARRLAAGSSRRLPTHRHDRRFSDQLSIPGEEMQGLRPTCGSQLLEGFEEPRELERGLGAERISIQSRSGLGSTARSCRRESPPGSEAVRRGESPNIPFSPNSIFGRKWGRCSADHVSQRELERT